MPTIACPKKINCCGGPTGINTLDADSPVSNFSSEAPDQILFGATGFPIWNPDNPLGRDPTGNDPNLPQAWFAQGCVAPVYSLISQDDANALAERQAFICQQQKRNPEPQLFFNVQQQCTYTCPDGLPFVWTIAAGFVVAGTQVQADTIAQSLACSNAAAHFMCLPAVAGGCVGTAYSQTLAPATGTAVKLPLTFIVVLGSLPPGLVFSQSQNTAFITGTPTSPGAFAFAIQVTDANGNQFQKSYTLNILGISNIGSLPTAMENTAYSVQLVGAGGTAPFTFALTSGSFPGITLSSSGLLSGTPNFVTAGSYPFTVQITDSTGAKCSQKATLTVTLRPGPDWTQFNWTQYQLNPGPGGNTATGSGIKNIATGALNADGVSVPNATISPVAASGVTYTGPGVTSRLILTVSFTGPVSNTMAMRLFRNGIQITGYAQAFTSGVFTLDFAVAASVGATFTIDDASPGNRWAQLFPAGNTGNLSFTLAIVNV